jgi:membrane-associated protease RseP (regulator of RpoE activity)
VANPSVPATQDDIDDAPPVSLTWRTVRLNVLLFVLTVVAVFWTGIDVVRMSVAGDAHVGLLGGWPYAVPLLAILLAHEFGHYFAARYHRVPASLPYFLPLPGLGFGTLGAVIAMRDRIRSRNALLDIGASGPLAGMLVAVPVLFWGIAHSPVSVSHPPFEQEGQSLIYVTIKWLVHGPIPAGSDVQLHPTALAGWAGLFLTMINLLPFGQLDGGHVAYALFGERQNRMGPWIRWAPLPLFLGNFAHFALPLLPRPTGAGLASAFGNSLFWLVWLVVLGVLARLSGKEHPPFDSGPLSRWRVAVGWLCVALFVGLFMPTPFSHVE